MIKEEKFYVAADKDSHAEVNLFYGKPRRFNCEGIEYWVGTKIGTMFSIFHVTWDDEPVEVEIKIKEK